jgi:NADPH:quinone reductase
MKSVRIFSHGGPDVLTSSDLELPAPSSEQVRIKIELAGINFIDVYHRRGQYPLPMTEGVGSGIGIEGIGRAPNGERVFWLSALGSYAQEINLVTKDVTTLPKTKLDNDEVLPLLCQGLTAHYLVDSAFKVEEGQWALVTAAAGGVGLLLTQLLKIRGANVIALASTAERATLAKEHGADVVGTYSEIENLTSNATVGAGVDVVFDSVGKDYFDICLSSLTNSGMYVLYGAASGPVPPFDLMRLNSKSLAIRRPTLATYTATEAERVRRLSELISLTEEGHLRYPRTKVFSMTEVQSAHRLIESRTHTGKIGIDPWKI